MNKETGIKVLKAVGGIAVGLLSGVALLKVGKQIGVRYAEGDLDVMDISSETEVTEDQE